MYMHAPHEFHAPVAVVGWEGEPRLTTPYEHIREWLWLNEGLESLSCRIVLYEISMRPDLSTAVREAYARDRNHDLLQLDRERLLELVMDNIVQIGVSAEIRNGFYTDRAGAQIVWLPYPLPY
jgi:hypothetical protein